MIKNSTFLCFVNSYQNEKTDLEVLDLLEKEQDVKSIFDSKSMFSPSTGSVNAILNFAKSYEVLHSKATGCIEMNKN